MTEKEAIERLELHKEWGFVAETMQAIDMAISSLEEIQQYRELGTVEGFKNKINDVKTLSRLYEKLSDQEVREYRELQTYKKLGTVEEFREAKKKRIPERPNIWGDGHDDEGEPIYDMYDCPSCGKSYEIDYDKSDYCPNCGQAIDWSDDK